MQSVDEDPNYLFLLDRGGKGLEENAAQAAAAVEAFLSTVSLDRLDLHPGFEDHLLRMRGYGFTLEFGPVDDGSAFEIYPDRKAIRFSLSAAALIYEGIARDPLSDSEQASAARTALLLFLFHELRHISQGLGAYGTVQELKKIGQEDLVAQYDLLADVEAAKDYALFVCSEGNEWRQPPFVQAFVQALYVHVHYCVPAFNYPLGSRWKMGRAIGLVLMLGRAALVGAITTPNSRRQVRPLTAAILVRPNPIYTKASIQWADRNWGLIAVVDDPRDHWLFEIAKAIHAKRMSTAVEIAIAYLLTETAFWRS